MQTIPPNFLPAKFLPAKYLLAKDLVDCRREFVVNAAQAMRIRNMGMLLNPLPCQIFSAHNMMVSIRRACQWRRSRCFREEAIKGGSHRRQGQETQLREVLPEGGVIRKLWIGETQKYRDHVLRLDADSRRNRFAGGVSDEFIRKLCRPDKRPRRRRARIFHSRHDARRRRVAAAWPAFPAPGGSRVQRRKALAKPRRRFGAACAIRCSRRAIAAIGICTWLASPTTGACSSWRANSTPS